MKAERKTWLPALVAASLVAIPLLVLYIRLWRRGGELARLKHERDVALAKAEADAVAAKVAKNTQRAGELEALAKQHLDRASSLDHKIKSLTNDVHKTYARIDSLKNWKDVDVYLGER